MAGPWDPTFGQQEDPAAQLAVDNLMGALGQPKEIQVPFMSGSPAPAAAPAAAPSVEDSAINSVMGLMTRMKTALPTGVSTEEAQSRQTAMEDATKTNWKKPAIAAGVLALVHLLGGKKGAAAAGRNMKLFSEGLMQGNQERIKNNVAGLKTGWDAQDSERKANADLLRSVTGAAIPEIIKSKITKSQNQPKEYQLYELASKDKDFAAFLERRKNNPDDPLSSDQYWSILLQKSARGEQLTDAERYVVEEVAKVKSGPAASLYQGAGVPGVVAPFAGYGGNNKKPAATAPLTKERP